jgi:glyoxylase-like metal-dependent hydrolase (beta-lactamase superfamily II)
MNSILVIIALWVNIFLAFGFALLHFLLVLGVPLGEYVLGGKDRVKPNKMKPLSLLFSIIFIMIGILFLQKGMYVPTIIASSLMNIIFIFYAIFLAICIPLNVFFTKSKKEKRVMTPLSVLGFVCTLCIIIMEIARVTPWNLLETGEVIPGIYAIEDGNANMYIIAIGDKYIAIDAANNASNIESELALLGISATDVTYVLLTHSHPDHVGALNLFTNATVYKGAGDLASKFKHPTEQLSDGEIIQIANRTIKCVYATAHHSDSVVFIIDDEIMFSGDNFILKDGKADLFVSFFNANDKQQKSDIRKLASIDGIKYVFTGHHGYVEGGVVE